ncbi:hypothetical protein BDR03DRAFT_382515 [Suillus americanus]|nr:hypothetical protein BDR03DRAFT_382515 [Suillus americanus]
MLWVAQKVTIPFTQEQMKPDALTYILDKKRLLLSWAEAKYIADDDPGSLCYLFPQAAGILLVLLKK